ncbi:hypothetical protein BK816_01370 [Boudabousia tangfeifanii]|uniref:DAGKc domain-containing protein n=1 Tax=Boudabousia tangfeifanii TaxID=1912795 RepID=A0A1D9MIK6_9ACTO|nr:diacylglycerol kinase family protein [Boudabousia tangfeifanii]AOZ72112.1 hypothetical protein BK816_01370 [Boudabousia tangfeifanii]
MDWFQLVLWILVLASLGVVIFLGTWGVDHAGKLGHILDTVSPEEHHADGSPVESAYVIFNPVKIEDQDLFERTCRESARHGGYHQVKFIATTEEDPGTKQAKQALAEGAKRIVAAGGDGTIRMVAGAIANSGIPMGLIPLGTGNLYARNLELPTDDLKKAIEIAFTTEPQSMDLAWIRTNQDDLGKENSTEIPPHSEVELGSEQPFLVIAGLGFDGAMMADTNDTLKDKIGWGAYVAAGIKNAFGKRLHVHIQRDDAEKWSDLKVRTLLIANCGGLPGMILIPDAKPNDSKLDIAALDVKRGVFGWASLGTKLFARNIGIDLKDHQFDAGSITYRQAKKVRVATESPQQVQIDGDPAGTATVIEVEIDAKALLVAAPQKSEEQ